jgi:DNA replication protein DnaC
MNDLSETEAHTPGLTGLLGRRGPFTCRCGAAVGHPGACDACSAEWDRQAFEKTMRPARESIPPHFQWAKFGNELLLKRCGPKSIRAVLDLPKPLGIGTVFVGPKNSGKTSLACAVLRRLHDWARHDRPFSEVEHARRAYFVSAPELIEAANRWAADEDRDAGLLRRARNASLLVLDNVEPGKLSDPVGRIVMGRHNADRPTIITTWMTESEAESSYGGGWARRAYDAVVEMGS